MKILEKNSLLYFTETEVSSSPIFIAQNYFDPWDPYTYDTDGTQIDKHVTKEFLELHPYACQLIISNISQSVYKLDVLRQIPVGSVPLAGGFYTSTKHVVVKAGESLTLFYYFYFPKVGIYKHFPVHVCNHVTFFPSVRNSATFVTFFFNSMLLHSFSPHPLDHPKQQSSCLRPTHPPHRRHRIFRRRFHFLGFSLTKSDKRRIPGIH